MLYVPSACDPSPLATVFNPDANDPNLGLYLNRAIYTPNVRFERDGQVEYCDVITCAAPNYSVGKKYGNVDSATNSKYLDSRIKFVLSIAAMLSASPPAATT